VRWWKPSGRRVSARRRCSSPPFRAGCGSGRPSR
jgi:hypothetical protein